MSNQMDLFIAHSIHYLLMSINIYYIYLFTIYYGLLMSINIYYIYYSLFINEYKYLLLTIYYGLCFV